MNYPKYEPGTRVCFTRVHEGELKIGSGVVQELWWRPVHGWIYSLSGWSGNWAEKNLMPWTEAFGEYFEKNFGEKNESK